MNLYQIHQSYRDLVRRVEETDGELTPELEEALEINQTDYLDKAEAYCVIIKEAQAEARALRDEEVRLAALRHSKEALVEKLKARLLACVLERGSIKLPAFRVYSSTSKSVEVSIPGDCLPLNCRRVTIEPDKAAIKSFLEKGEEIPGCKLVNKTNLVIK